MSPFLNASPLEFSQQASKKIADVCKFFTEPLGLTTMGYKRIFEDGRYVFLSTNLDWVTYHYQNIHDHGTFFQNAMRQVSSSTLYKVLWPDSPQDHFLESLNHFGMWNGINFYRERNGFLELWTFSTSPERSNMSQLYINKVNCFEKFIRYFSLQLDSLINIQDKSQFAHMNVEPLFKEKIPPTFVDFPDAASQSKIDKIIKGRGGDITELTPREIECVKLWDRGMRTKTVAREMKVSPRTVEDYARKIRLKTGCGEVYQILDAFKLF